MGQLIETSQSPSSVAIGVEHVTKTFLARGRTVTALADISAEVGKGEFVSIVGPSGCGKTTLLRLIAGLMEPTAGSVHIHGRQPGTREITVGVAFQKPVLLPWRTVLSNVLLPLEIEGRRKSDQRATQHAHELLGQVGLADFADVRPHELSLGMQQRVALCRALVKNPSLLLMDEPFAALDAMTREQMAVLLHDLWLKNRTTAIFITHSIPEAVFLSTSVIVMTARPSRVAMTLSIDLPTPRDLRIMGDPRFAEFAQAIRSAIYPDSERSYDESQAGDYLQKL